MGPAPRPTLKQLNSLDTHACISTGKGLPRKMNHPLALLLPCTLDCDSRSLRLARLTLVDGAHWDDVSASLAYEYFDEVLVLPSFPAVIFSTSGKKAAKACIRCEVRVAQLHDDEPLGDNLPQLAIALVSWLRGALRRHGHVPLANGLLLDTHGLERATDRPPPSHQLQPTACIAVSGLNVEPSGDHGGLSLQLSVRIEGRRLFGGSIGHTAQHLLTSAEQTTLRNRGYVELQHRLESEGGPAPPQCRLLPHLHVHSLLRLDTLPPLPPPPADEAADDAAEDATDYAEPLAPRDAEGHRRLWGESHGLWLPATALGPFATVAGAFGRTLVVPAACVWPAAPLRALRSDQEVPWAPCLQRLTCLIERQRLTALGKASIRFTQGVSGSGLPPSAEGEEGAAGRRARGVGGWAAAAAAADGTGESAAALLGALVFTPSSIFTSAKALITSGGSSAVTSLVPPPGLELLSTSLASRDAARALAPAPAEADAAAVSAPRVRVRYHAPFPTSSHAPALSPASRPHPGGCKGHGSSGRASGLATTPMTATAAKRSKEPVLNPVASGDPRAAPTPAAGMAAWAAAGATAPEAAAKLPPPPPQSTAKPRPPTKSPPSAPAAPTPPAWASKPPSTSAAPKEPLLPSATTSKPPLPAPSVTIPKLPAPSATTSKPPLPAPSVTTQKLPAPSVTIPKLPAPSATIPKLPAPSATTQKLPAPSALKKRRPAPEAMAEAASGNTSGGNPPPAKRRRVTFAPDVTGGDEPEEMAGKPTPPLLLPPPRSPRCTGKATAMAAALSLDLFGDGDDDNYDDNYDASPSPLSTPPNEAAELFGAGAGCAEAFGRVKWPGEQPSEWLLADGTLTRAARMLVEAAVRRYGRAQDGALGHTELNSLNCAMGGADLDQEDFEHVCSFNDTEVADVAGAALADAAVTSEGFVRYMSQYLASDFDEARADLRKLGLVA